jgi:hypothetical protein
MVSKVGKQPLVTSVVLELELELDLELVLKAPAELTGGFWGRALINFGMDERRADAQTSQTSDQ